MTRSANSAQCMLNSIFLEFAMPKTKKKKYKHKPKMPPLSKIDKFLYALLVLAGVCGVIGLGFCAYLCVDVLLRGKNTIAYTWDSPLLLLVVPLSLFVMVTAVYCIENAVQQKHPIIGNKDFKYGQTPGYVTIYPIFDKRYAAYRKAKKKQPHKIWWCTFVVTLILAVFGIFDRWSFETDGIYHYNCLNQCTEQYAYSDVSAFQVQANYAIRPRQLPKPYLRISMILQNEKEMDVSTGLGCTLPDFCAVYKQFPQEAQIPSEDDPQIYLKSYDGEYTEQIQEMFSVDYA